MTTVLVVEDDKQLANALVGELARLGHEVLLATSTRDALDLLFSEDVAILLTDLRMSGRDGIELIEEARAASPHTRSILMSAYATAKDYKLAVELGAVDVLTKPFTPSDLEQAISRALECHDGFRGDVHGFALSDLLQMFHQARRSLTVHVDDANGAVYLDKGIVVHATCGLLRGEEALRALLRRHSGSIRTSPFVEGEQTIHTKLDALLLELAVSEDEHRRSIDPLTGEAGPVPTLDLAGDLGISAVPSIPPPSAEPDPELTDVFGVDTTPYEAQPLPARGGEPVAPRAKLPAGSPTPDDPWGSDPHVDPTSPIPPPIAAAAPAPPAASAPTTPPSPEDHPDASASPPSVPDAPPTETRPGAAVGGASVRAARASAPRAHIAEDPAEVTVTAAAPASRAPSAVMPIVEELPPSRAGRWAALAAALVVVIGGAVWFGSGGEAPTPLDVTAGAPERASAAENEAARARGGEAPQASIPPARAPERPAERDAPATAATPPPVTAAPAPAPRAATPRTAAAPARPAPARPTAPRSTSKPIAAAAGDVDTVVPTPSATPSDAALPEIPPSPPPPVAPTRPRLGIIDDKKPTIGVLDDDTSKPNVGTIEDESP